MVRGTQDWISQTNHFQQRGEQGLNKGIPYRITRLNKYVPGTQHGRYLLYFAGPGVGKSRIVYDQHIFVPYDYKLEHPEVDLHIHLWSLEINPIFVIGGAKVYWLYTRKGIITDINHIFSIGEEKLCAEIKMLIDSRECQEYIEGLMSCLNIYTEEQGNEDAIHKIIMDFASSRGTFTKDVKGFIHYKPTNENELVIVIVDHISLVTPNKGNTLKMTIDNVSSNFKKYRRMGYAPIAIQQINPEKYEKESDKVLPKHEDLRDSKNTYQDCDAAISLGNPFNLGIRTFSGYKIVPDNSLSMDGLEDRFRILQVCKNRYGNVSIIIPTLFIGEVGYYKDIDPPNKLNYAAVAMIQKYKKS